jgi:hypothetical protein
MRQMKFTIPLGAARLSVLALMLLPVVAAPVRATTSPSDNVSVADADTRVRIKGILSEYLSNMQPTWKLRQCSTAVSYHPPMPSGHDSSWGAVCIVDVGGKPQGRWFCGDWMVGTFSSRLGGDTTAERLGRFVASECQPGA